jgi:hypothetical protein
VKKVEMIDTKTKAKAKTIGVPGGLEGLKAFDKFNYLNILLHAPGGRGKTTFISDACDDPRTSPLLVLDCEGGSPIRFAKKDPTTYTIIPIDSIDQLSQIFNYLNKGDHPYKSVALDSLTAIQKIGLNEFIYGTDSHGWTDLKQAEIQQWGKSLNQMLYIMQKFKELKMHVFFTTLSQRQIDEVSKKVWVTVQLPGQQVYEIPGIPDIVGYIDIVKTKSGLERVLQVQPDGQVDCKDRSDALGLGIKLSTSGNVTKLLDVIWDYYKLEKKEGRNDI